jgi:hypothetical protein
MSKPKFFAGLADGGENGIFRMVCQSANSTQPFPFSPFRMTLEDQQFEFEWIGQGVP